MFANVNIPAPADGAAGSPQGKDTNIVIFNWDDVSNDLSRDQGKINLEGNYLFKAGKYATTIYGTSSSISLPLSSEGDEDAVGLTALPEFSHPGSSLEIEEFFANNMNKPLGVAVRVGACDGVSPYYKVYGTRCNPLSLLPEIQDDNEANKKMLKFQQFRKTTIFPARYHGTFTFATANVVAADSTTVDVAAGDGEYQLTDNAAATIITNLTNAANGKFYTLIGSGGANPATIEASNSNFLMGTDFSGIAGARITFQAYTHSGGTVFIEKSRS